MHVHLLGAAWNIMLPPDAQLADKDIPFDKFLFPYLAKGVTTIQALSATPEEIVPSRADQPRRTPRSQAHPGTDDRWTEEGVAASVEHMGLIGARGQGSRSWGERGRLRQDQSLFLPQPGIL